MIAFIYLLQKKELMRVFCTANHTAALLVHFDQLIAGQTRNICSISGFLWVASLINKCIRDFLIFGVFFLTIQKPTQAACNSSRQEIFHCVGQSTWKWFTCTWVQSFWHRSMAHSSLQSFLPQTSVLHANQLLEQGSWKSSVASNYPGFKSSSGIYEKETENKSSRDETLQEKAAFHATASPEERVSFPPRL